MDLIDQLEQADSHLLFKREHHDVVDNQQVSRLQSLILLSSSTGDLLEFNSLDNLIHSSEQCPVAKLERVITKPASKKGLACTTGAYEHHVEVLVQPEQLPQLLELSRDYTIDKGMVVFVQVMEQRKLGCFCAPFKLGLAPAQDFGMQETECKIAIGRQLSASIFE